MKWNAMKILDDKGVIILVVYLGHENGKMEESKLVEYVKTIDQRQYEVLTYRFINQINNPPYVIAIERK